MAADFYALLAGWLVEGLAIGKPHRVFDEIFITAAGAGDFAVENDGAFFNDKEEFWGARFARRGGAEAFLA